MTYPHLCRVLPSLATWGRANPERCPKFLEFKPNTSVYVCITGLVRWAGKYIAKDDYTTSGCDSRRGHSGAVKERNTKAANGSGTSMCPIGNSASYCLVISRNTDEMNKHVDG